MNVFVLTGAGISAESGLGTFRDKGGIWSRFDPMKLATPEAFARDPDAVHAFYNLRRSNLRGAEPNAAHQALARLEAGLFGRGDKLFLCTQNIDDLHERTGSREVLHMHGELLKARCVHCGAVVP
jgi:NAD-dependent deacetylase